MKAMTSEEMSVLCADIRNKLGGAYSLVQLMELKKEGVDTDEINKLINRAVEPARYGIDYIVALLNTIETSE